MLMCDSELQQYKVEMLSRFNVILDSIAKLEAVLVTLNYQKICYYMVLLMFYWKNEESGLLQGIVLKFLRNETLEADELRILQDYIYKFADSMPVKPLDLERIYQLKESGLRRYILNTLVGEFSIDPF